MTKRKTRNSQDSQSLWGKLSSSWFRVKSWYFTFHRIISFPAKKKEKRNKKKRKKERKKENIPIEGLRAREEQFALIHRNSIGQSFERKCIVNNWTDSRLLAETKWPTLFDKRKVLLESRTTSGHLRWNEGRGNWRDSFFEASPFSFY